jgi:heme-degrading monooxygenase HmoA
LEFENEAALRAWRMHPEHRAAQQKGRDSFYEEYKVQVCEVLREVRFART